VKKPSPRLFLTLIPISLIVLVDEWMKYLALKRLPDEGSLVDPGIVDFAIHRNVGIAFDLPFKMPIIILVSIVIGYFLFKVIRKNFVNHPDIATASAMIIIGALGNLYDRIVYAFTVDYIIILGRLAINLSDMVIVSGVIWLLMASRRSKKHHRIHPDEARR
jgi:signal peptidase II